MNLRFIPRWVVGLMVAAGCVAAPAVASAATIAPIDPCPTYVPGVNGGERYVGVVGSGFLPLTSVNFGYDNGGGGGGFLTANPLGGLFGGVLGPNSIIGNRSHHVFSYTLTGSDSQNAAIFGSTKLQVVRFDATTPRRPRPTQTITWRLYGFPRNKTVWAHYVYHGKIRRTVRFGAPSGPCGLRSFRVRALPTRVRVGIWRIYLTNSRAFSTKLASQRQYLIYLAYNVYRRYVPRASSVSATVRRGGYGLAATALGRRSSGD